MSKRSHRCAAWLALVAILLGVLAPSIARAVAGSIGADIAWVEVCTPQGAKFVAVPADQAPLSDSSSPHAFQSEHCPFCVAGALALLPALDRAPFLGDPPPARLQPARLLEAPRAQHVWSATRPRAPPFLS